MRKDREDMNSVNVCIKVLLLALFLCQSGQSQETTNKFDPSRDAEKDIQEAIARAGQTHQRILLDIGGEWCGWCHTLDRFFKEQKDLMSVRDQNYIWVKVNFSPENENKTVLSRYSEIKGLSTHIRA
jgi:thioredoxin-related protein